MALEPAPAPLGPNASAAFAAETWSTFAGNQILHRLAEAAERRRGGA